MSKQAKREKALRFYAFLLKFYPRGYTHSFGSQMLQTFKDQYADVIELSEHSGVNFWFDVMKDEVKGIAREQILSVKRSKYMRETWIKRGLLFGILLGIVHIGYNAVNNLAPANTTLTHFLNNGILLVVLIFTGTAGYVTARKAGKVSAGTYAGLLTGVLSIVIGMSALFVITFAFMDIIRHNAFMLYDFHQSALKSVDQFIIEDAIGATFVGTLFSIIAGGVFGTLGGYLGIQLKKL